ncbi:MAG: DegT/DnrJ/EryC1/StrS family aminotransferase [Anaerolineae bacterium]|nr:DegT/DnrJ/EryC1/StrS family aminotransferase [Anaerolineae bacterium]
MSTSPDKLPLVDLHRQYETIRPEIQAAVNSVLERTDFIMGKAVSEFEAAFAAFCGAKHAIGVASGTAAIHLALHALDVEAGDEVITVPNTFIATTEPIISLGAKPVFVDVDPERFTLDPPKLEDAITPKTRAIIPVHLYGQCADMDPILEIAGRHGIPVVEDAAQAHGATYHGRKAGTMGIMGCFSFYPSKNLGAYGDAGGLVTDDPVLAERIERLRNHGRKDKYEHLESGYGERLDTLQAAILKVKLAHLAKWNERRQYLAECYNHALTDIPKLLLPKVSDECKHVFHLYVVRHPQRDVLQAHLKKQGIHSGIHYPIPLHLQPAYQDLGYAKNSFPVAEMLAEHILSLPLFPEMLEGDVERVAGAIRKL